MPLGLSPLLFAVQLLYEHALVPRLSVRELLSLVQADLKDVVILLLDLLFILAAVERVVQELKVVGFVLE